MKAIDSAYL